MIASSSSLGAAPPFKKEAYSFAGGEPIKKWSDNAFPILPSPRPAVVKSRRNALLNPGRNVENCFLEKTFSGDGKEFCRVGGEKGIKGSSKILIVALKVFSSWSCLSFSRS